MTNTTIEQVKDYLKNVYDLDFKEETYNYHKWIHFEKGKKEYQINCQYCFNHKKQEHIWSICYDFMDKEIWSGYGYFEEDEGMKTVDYIMQQWGFKKVNNHTTIFDFIGSD